MYCFKAGARCSLFHRMFQHLPTATFQHRCERRLLTSRCPKLQAKRNCDESVSARRNKPSNDTAASPHQSNGAVVEGPAKLYGRLPQQHEALSVGDDLRCIEGLRKLHGKKKIEEKVKNFDKWMRKCSKVPHCHFDPRLPGR